MYACHNCQSWWLIHDENTTRRSCSSFTSFYVLLGLHDSCWHMFSSLAPRQFWLQLNQLDQFPFHVVVWKYKHGWSSGMSILGLFSLPNSPSQMQNIILTTCLAFFYPGKLWSNVWSLTLEIKISRVEGVTGCDYVSRCAVAPMSSLKELNRLTLHDKPSL